MCHGRRKCTRTLFHLAYISLRQTSYTDIHRLFINYKNHEKLVVLIKYYERIRLFKVNVKDCIILRLIYCNLKY